MHQQKIRARGKVISLLAKVTDFAESLIFLGRLEQVCAASLTKPHIPR